MRPLPGWRNAAWGRPGPENPVRRSRAQSRIDGGHANRRANATTPGYCFPKDSIEIPIGLQSVHSARRPVLPTRGMQKLRTRSVTGAAVEIVEPFFTIEQETSGNRQIQSIAGLQSNQRMERPKVRFVRVADVIQSVIESDYAVFKGDSSFHLKRRQD